jgi:metal-responsive CopG/Arc/MetJ family transcriptional regulator
MAKPSVAVGQHRGASRAGEDTLAKTTVTLPKGLIAQADRAVIDRKQLEPTYNRSALVEEALRAWLTTKVRR